MRRAFPLMFVLALAIAACVRVVELGAPMDASVGHQDAAVILDGGFDGGGPGNDTLFVDGGGAALDTGLTGDAM